jgi:hypothetical protein
MPERGPDDLLTPAEASRTLGVTPDAVRPPADKGQLPVLRTETGRRHLQARPTSSGSPRVAKRACDTWLGLKAAHLLDLQENPP